jgi:copper chaperone CopZ
MSTTVTEPTQEVTGMTRASCVRRIEKALGKVEAVQEASVNLATEMARVVYDPSRASLDTVAEAVHKAATVSARPLARAPARRCRLRHRPSPRASRTPSAGARSTT